MKRHVIALHTVKTCNECDFKTISLSEMKSHKKTKHDPDDYEEESAFNKLFYNKTWKVRGFKDPISTLQVYKAKIQKLKKEFVIISLYRFFVFFGSETGVWGQHFPTS